MNLTKPIIFYDIESTGVDRESDKILEIYAVKIYPDGTRKTFETMLNPGKEIPEKITAINKITNEMVKNCPTFEEMFMKIYEFMTDDEPDLCGFGTNFFDNSFMAEKFSPYDLMFPLPTQKMLDVCDIHKFLNPRSLAAAYLQYMGIPLENAHRASADTEATISVFEKQLEAHPELGGSVDEAEKVMSQNYKIVDVSRKLTRNDEGQVIYNIGASRGIRVKSEPSFGQWMLKQQWCTPNTAYHLRKELDLPEVNKDIFDEEEDYEF